MMIGAGVIALIGFAAVVWIAYGIGLREGLSRAPAVVEAPDEPYRTEVNEPGAQQPGQDLEVLAQASRDGEPEPDSDLREEAARQEAERAEAEEAARERAEAIKDEDAEAEAENDRPAEAVEPAPQARPLAGETSDAGSGAGDQAGGSQTTAGTDAQSNDAASQPGEPEPDSEPKPKPETETAPGQSPSTESTETAGGAIFVQVGSYTSKDDAQNGWQQLATTYAGVVSEDQSHTVRTATLDDGRIVHRLRAGPFAGKDEAEAFCTDLKEAGGDCFVTTR
jgi:hypothetical protein